jgi:hypothetical protein
MFSYNYNFRVNKEPLNCICSGVVNTETGKSVNVKFDLGFTGDVSAEKIKEIDATLCDKVCQ